MEYPPASAEPTSTGAQHVAAPAPAAASARRVLAQKVLAFAMIGMIGMEDSAMGANLSSMQAHYRVSFDTISLVFLSNTAGYFASAASSSFIHHHFGLWWLLIIAAATKAVGCAVVAAAPPFPAFVIALAFLGYGTGLYDTSLTSVVSHEEDGVAMSLMYALFGVGAGTAPLIVGAFIDASIPWNYYYFIPLGLALTFCLAGVFVFKGYEDPADEAAAYDAQADTTVHARATLSVKTRMARALRLRAAWAGFLLIIASFAIANILSGWVITWAINERHVDEASARWMLSGVWFGIAAGRVVLAYALERRLGERPFALLVLSLVAGFLAVLWAVKNVPTDGAAMALVGFFLGPITPKIMSAVSARVPTSLKTVVMSMTIGLGLIGSSVGPLTFGVAAGKGYLGSLPGVLIVLAGMNAAGWFLMPKRLRVRQD